MKFNTNKILAEWAYRVDDGQPDVTNVDHINHLREVLYNFGLPHKFIVEYVHGLTEAEMVKNPNPKGRKDMVTKPYANTFLAKNSKAKSDNNSEKKVLKSKKTKVKVYPKKAKDKEWSGRSNDEIIDAVSTKTQSAVIPTKGSEDIKNRVNESRAETMSGKTGKGGGETTIQEEFTNIGRELTIADSNIKKSDLAEAIIKHVKENYPDSKIANNPNALKRLANKSIAGFDSAKEVTTNPSFNYNKEQPKGYPVNTTDSQVVRDVLVTQLKNAKTSEAIAHAKEELYEFQLNAGDKSITGKEGDADTIMVYKDNNGNDRVCYISNKQTLGDQQSSGTVNSSRRSILYAAEKLNMTDKEKADVVRVAETQFEKADKFDENMATGVKETVKEFADQLSTPQAKSTMAKAAQALSGRSKFGKSNDDLTPKELAKKKKYTTNSLKKPEVLAKLMGNEGPPSNDVKSKEYKDWAKNTKSQFEADGKTYSDEDIVNSATMVTGTGGVTKGNHLRTNEKIAIVTRDINIKMQKKIDGGLSPEEAAKELKEEFAKPDKKGNTMYGNVFNESDLIEINSNPGLRGIEKAERGRKQDIEGMQKDTTAELIRLDAESGHTKPPANGPRTQAYVKGFLDRIHVTQNVAGTADGRKLTEMGEHSLSPKDYRTALAKTTGFASEEEYIKNNPDGNYNKALEKHLVENVEVEAGTMNLVYVSNQIDESTGKRKKVHIGTDTHRTGGSISKVAGELGKDVQVELAETTKQ